MRWSVFVDSNNLTTSKNLWEHPGTEKSFCGEVSEQEDKLELRVWPCVSCSVWVVSIKNPNALTSPGLFEGTSVYVHVSVRFIVNTESVPFIPFPHMDHGFVKRKHKIPSELQEFWSFLSKMHLFSCVCVCVFKVIRISEDYPVACLAVPQTGEMFFLFVFSEKH